MKVVEISKLKEFLKDRYFSIRVGTESGFEFFLPIDVGLFVKLNPFKNVLVRDGIVMVEFCGIN